MASTKYEDELEKNNDYDEISYWETLPIHLLEMILLHLLDGHNDVDRFRVTCKSWQSVTLPVYMMPIPKKIQSSNQLLPLLQSSSSSSSSSPQIPWLMFFAQGKSCGSGSILKFLHPITSETYVIEIPELDGAVFRYSKNDWMLMSRGKHSFFFFNPFTMSTTKLLDVHKVFEIFNMCFRAPPTSPGYEVFAHGLHYSSIELHFYNNEWFTDFIKEDEETTPTPFRAVLCTPVLCKGNIYSLGDHGMLGVYSPDKEPDWEVIRETKLPKISYSSRYLAECDGELVSVFVGSSGKPVRVYRFDWSMSRWQELDSLGSKTMFVSESGSVLIEAKGIENRIYFPRFRSKEGSEIPGRRQDHIQRSRGCSIHFKRASIIVIGVTFLVKIGPVQAEYMIIALGLMYLQIIDPLMLEHPIGNIPMGTV